MQRLIFTMLLLTSLSVSVMTITSCQTMGHATGEAVEEVDEASDEFEEGYERGRE